MESMMQPISQRVTQYEGNQDIQTKIQQNKFRFRLSTSLVKINNQCIMLNKLNQRDQK